MTTEVEQYTPKVGDLVTLSDSGAALAGRWSTATLLALEGWNTQTVCQVRSLDTDDTAFVSRQNDEYGQAGWVRFAALNPVRTQEPPPVPGAIKYHTTVPVEGDFWMLRVRAASGDQDLVLIPRASRGGWEMTTLSGYPAGHQNRIVHEMLPPDVIANYKGWWLDPHPLRPFTTTEASTTVSETESPALFGDDPLSVALREKAQAIHERDLAKAEVERILIALGNEASRRGWCDEYEQWAESHGIPIQPRYQDVEVEGVIHITSTIDATDVNRIVGTRLGATMNATQDVTINWTVSFSRTMEVNRGDCACQEFDGSEYLSDEGITYDDYEVEEISCPND
jgi:hypothetical protein